MTRLNTMESVNFVALTDEELMEMEGGAWPIVVWAVANPVAAAKIAGGLTAGSIAAYNLITGKW